MSIGPVEYMIVAFPGNRFKGEIVPALQELVDAGTIRIIDLAFVMKDADGAVVTAEMADLDPDVFKAFALLVWEDVWATKVRDAIRNAGGELLDLERIPGEVVEAAVEFANANK
jgi:hypothetical protein